MPAAATAVAEAPAGPPLLAAPAVSSPPESIRFGFNGEAREFFRIWIVNTLLTVLTLGVFNAWAKVRKRRYFRGSTEFLGHRFNYTADPRRVLIGNLIVLVLFLAYALFGVVYPGVRFGAIVVFVVLLPWIVVRSLSFNAHHTMYRGLRFRFHPSVSAAALLYLGQALLIVVTLGFYYPAWARARQEFVIGRHRFGTGYFHLKLTSGRFFRAYFAAGAMMMLTAAIVGGITVVILKGNAGHVATPVQLLPAMALYALAAYVAKHYIFAEVFKTVWNEVRLDEHRFRTTLDTRRWLGLQLTNLAAMIVTCGLAYPWAAIRSTRYVVTSLEFIPSGSIENLAAMGTASGSALGDTAAEFAGLDFGL